jgi:hypothetical protein
MPLAIIVVAILQAAAPRTRSEHSAFGPLSSFLHLPIKQAKACPTYSAGSWSTRFIAESQNVNTLPELAHGLRQ